MAISRGFRDPSINLARQESVPHWSTEELFEPEPRSLVSELNIASNARDENRSLPHLSARFWHQSIGHCQYPSSMSLRFFGNEVREILENVFARQDCNLS